MIRVTFGPEGQGKYKFLRGKVELDGVDVSNRITALTFRRNQDGSNVLTLDAVIHGEDALLLDIPDEDLVVNAKVVRNGEVIEATAIGHAAKKYLA